MKIKMLLLGLLLLNACSAPSPTSQGLASRTAENTGTESQGEELTWNRLVQFLTLEGHLPFGEDPLQAIDDGTFETSSVVLGGTRYDYLKMYSGDTEHGALYLPATMNLVGGNSDGEFYLRGLKPVDAVEVAVDIQAQFDALPLLTQFQLTLYFSAIGKPETALAQLGDEIVRVKTVEVDGSSFEYVSVHGGDTEYGPLFVPGTFHLVGENGDGSFYFYEKLWLD